MAMDRAAISTIHNIAAACQLWLCTRPERNPGYRHTDVPNSVPSELAQDSLALGFIDRLCQTFVVDPADRELITYVYLLIDGHGPQALDRLTTLTSSLTKQEVGLRINEGALNAEKLLASILIEDSGRSA